MESCTIFLFNIYFFTKIKQNIFSTHLSFQPLNVLIILLALLLDGRFLLIRFGLLTPQRRRQQVLRYVRQMRLQLHRVQRLVSSQGG